MMELGHLDLKTLCSSSCSFHIALTTQDRTDHSYSTLQGDLPYKSKPLRQCQNHVMEGIIKLNDIQR